MTSSDIRPAALAGQWYDADPEVLRRNVERLLEGAEAPSHAHAVVAVAPHAGHVWSGAVAGRVLGLLRHERYERVVVLAPNHRHPLGHIAATDAAGFATPLGTVPVDRDAVALLAEQGAAILSDEAHRHEHAIEIQLPLLQVLWDSPPPIVPLLVPHLAERERTAVASTLGRWCDGKTLFLISTDFTHYGADFGYLPFRDDLPRRLEELDKGAVRRILDWDAAGLRAYGLETGITMCGLEAAALVMELPWPDPPATSLIDYARSGDSNGDYEMSVSYAGMIGAWPRGGPP